MKFHRQLDHDRISVTRKHYDALQERVAALEEALRTICEIGETRDVQVARVALASGSEAVTLLEKRLEAAERVIAAWDRMNASTRGVAPTDELVADWGWVQSARGEWKRLASGSEEQP